MKNEAIKWHVRDDLDAARMCSVEDYYFDTEAEAIAFASNIWAHQTRAAKRQEGGITVTKECLHLDEDGEIADDEWNLSDSRWLEDVLTLNWANDPENPANQQEDEDAD